MKNNLINNDVDPMVYNMSKIVVGDDKQRHTNLKNGLIFKQVLLLGKLY